MYIKVKTTNTFVTHITQPQPRNRARALGCSWAVTGAFLNARTTERVFGDQKCCPFGCGMTCMIPEPGEMSASIPILSALFRRKTGQIYQILLTTSFFILYISYDVNIQIQSSKASSNILFSTT